MASNKYEFIDRSIYSILDPRNNKKIAYIGQSINPIERFKNHYRDNDNNRKSEWLNELAKLNLKPILKIEKTIYSSQFTAFEWEMHFTVKYRDLGYEILSVGNDKIQNIYSLKKE